MLLKTPIDFQVIARLNALLNTEDLDTLIGPPHALLRPTRCAISDKHLTETAHMVEGLGYVSTEVAALLLIRGLVEYIHDLERVKTLQNEFAARTLRHPKGLGEILADVPTPKLIDAFMGKPTPDGSELVAKIVPHESIPQTSVALVSDMSIQPDGKIKVESVSLIENVGGGHTEPGPEYVVGDFVKGGLGPGVAIPENDAVRAEQARVAASVKPKKIVRGEDGPGWHWLRKKDGVSLTGVVEVAAGAKVDIRNLPEGTVVRFAAVDGPVVPTEDPRVFPTDGSPVCAEDAALVRTQFDIDHGIVAPPAIARKWEGAHVVDLPEVDISHLAADDQEVFEGYKPGRHVFASASDTYRYEREVGGDIMEAVEASFAEDDIRTHGRVITEDDVKKEKGRQRQPGGAMVIPLPGRCFDPQD